MNYELFITQRILFKSTAKDYSYKGSQSIIRISIFAVAIGLVVMILSTAIVTGFQKEIRNKVIGFGSHIQVNSYDTNTSYEINPINKNQELYKHLGSSIEGIRHIQVYATKAGIIKTEKDIEGIVLKGIGKDFDWGFFKKNLIEGNIFQVSDTVKSNHVLISKYLSRKLNLKLGDNILLYFIQQPPRARKFIIKGIYESGLEDFDKLYLLCDIAHIQKLNDWTEEQVGGFEILIDDFDKLNKVGNEVYSDVGYELNAQTIKEIYPQLFDWLELQNINVIVIITLMIIVAVINMISTILIIILERTNMIGILKALGATNWSIRKIFLYTGAYLIGIGILIGNIAGISLCLLQKYLGIITLPQESYYISVVPINFSFSTIMILNIGTLFICIIMLILPSYIITKITPVKAIRYS